MANSPLKRTDPAAKAGAGEGPWFAPARPGETSEQRKKRLLASEPLAAAIRKIARARSVPEQDVDDVVQKTYEQAWKAKLDGMSDDEAMAYTLAIAKNVTCRHMGEAIEAEADAYNENPDVEKGEVATQVAVDPPNHAKRAALHRLVEAGEQRFPAGFAAFVEAKATDQTAAEVAKHRNVSAGHVRKEWSSYTKFLRDHPIAVSLLGGALLVLLVVGFAHWQLGIFGAEDKVAAPLPSLTAPELRARAKAECAEEQWQACVEDLDRAARVDPKGDTKEWRELGDAARAKAKE